MALASYTPPRKDIPAGNTTLSVRGLNLEDMALLMQAHGDKLMAAYTKFEALTTAQDPDMGLMSSVVIGLVTDSPVVAGDLIALACDEPESNVIARTLPFPVQVAALTEVGRLTFEAGGGLGNFLAVLKGLSDGLGLSPLTTSPLPTFPPLR